jgi:ankyrin repeat protein
VDRRQKRTEAETEMGEAPLHSTAARSRKNVAELLLANKADVKARNVVGMTHLHSAAGSGSKDVAELPITCGKACYQ